MNTIQVTGQVISSTNYTTNRLFNFSPQLIREAAENFLASGITEIEIPQGVLDPDNKNPDTGVHEETIQETIAGLPGQTRVLGTYIGGGGLGDDNDAFVATQSRSIENLCRYFPDMTYGMLHPAGKDQGDPDKIKKVVEGYAMLAEKATAIRGGFQLTFHNHFDSSGESAEQVRAYLAAIAEANLPSLRWGVDIGHCHGMGDDYLDVLDEYAHLVGDFFHIKARVPAFDQLHGGDAYRADRDIWGNEAEFGSGLYSGFVNAADPEMETPFADVFRILREKATPTSGVCRGAMEIDIPRQHPRLEIMCTTLYLKNVHGVESAMALSNDEIVAGVFGTGG
jgi:sugar phosphate isomerase/epimerase